MDNMRNMFPMSFGSNKKQPFAGNTSMKSHSKPPKSLSSWMDEDDESVYKPKDFISSAQSNSVKSTTASTLINTSTTSNVDLISNSISNNDLKTKTSSLPSSSKSLQKPLHPLIANLNSKSSSNEKPTHQTANTNHVASVEDSNEDEEVIGPVPPISSNAKQQDYYEDEVVDDDDIGPMPLPASHPAGDEHDMEYEHDAEDDEHEEEDADEEYDGAEESDVIPVTNYIKLADHRRVRFKF